VTVDGTRPAERACSHCGLPVIVRVRGEPTPPADEPLYCCVGCRLAASVAAGSGSTLEPRLLLASFLAMGVMTFSLVLYGETLHATGDEPGLAAVRNMGRAVLALFSLPVLGLLGVPLVRGALADLALRRVRMDGLIVLATFAAFGLSLAHTWSGEGEVYYDTATMVLVLVTFGRRLEARARTHGRDADEALAECLPAVAHRLDDDGTGVDVGPATLVSGDRCLLRPGEAVPADVLVEEGRGEITCAHVTGESAPRAVGPGDELPAGAITGATALTVRVLRPVASSTLARLRELLDAPLPSTRWTRAVDRLAGWLALLALALALAGGLAAFQRAGAGAALSVALSVLVVACPCALGLATPLAYRAMRVALARRGLLVHDAAALERAARVDLVVLDKTGTLTDPRPEGLAVTASSPRAGEHLRALVRASGHAIGAAFSGERAVVPSGLALVPGSGVTGTLDGVRCRAGSPAWMDHDGLAWEAEPAEARARLAGSGATLVALAEEDRVTALGALEHGLRPGAEPAVAALRAMGVGAVVLSGDHAQAAEAVGEQLGVPSRGGCTPADKLAHLEGERGRGAHVLFAGDGLNDAPALRAADVGVAMASGTALARGQAAIELVSEDLRALPRLLAGARALRRVALGNLAWTVIYNVVLLGLATSGRLHPLAAAVAMIASSLLVSVKSYRLMGWDER
jgi:heavy metal translocating P-type ATPase